MINYITFADKNKNGKTIEQISVTVDNINQILSTVNQSINFLNKDHLLIKSVNGKVGNIEIKFPVLSVNGKYNDINLNLNSYVNSVNGKTGNVKIDFPVLSVNNKKDIVNIIFPVLSINNLSGNINLKTSNIYNDINYITEDDIKVYSVNDKLKNIIIKISQLQNIYKFITRDNILVKSVNDKLGNVQIIPPVLSVNNEVGKISFLETANVTSVNNLSGNINLKLSNIENDINIIKYQDILVKSITITNNSDQNQLISENIKIFVPNKNSQLQNDINLFNHTNQFIKVYQNNIEDLNNFITCRFQKYTAFIDLKKCIGCGKCKAKCQYAAIQITKINNNDIYQVNPIKCINCKVCFTECQVTAILQKLQ